MQDAKEEVRGRLAIEDIIGEYIELKRAGRNFKGLSPFTAEKTPSFFVSPEKNIWHDFSDSTEANIGSDKIKEKYSSTWGELGIGVQIPVTNSAYVYTDLRYERSFKSSPKHNGYRGTVGFKYTF